MGGNDKFESLLRAARSGDVVSLARLLTRIESLGSASLSQSELLKPQTLSLRIGITGPPGAGKSTLISGLIEVLRKKNLSVAILAVDPSSPFSKGAILGDRIRFNHFHNDKGVFVRSIGSRGSLGGVGATAYLFTRALETCGFDIILIETVGVGQSEVEIMNIADVVTVVLVPESGDSIQAMKAGLFEIADLFVVNKCDRPGADILTKELEVLENFSQHKKQVQVLQTVALSLQGVENLCQTLLDIGAALDLTESRKNIARLKAEARCHLRSKIEDQIESSLKNIRSSEDILRVMSSISGNSFQDPT